MVDMTTLQMHAWLLAKPGTVADITEVFLTLFRGFGRVHFLDTLWLKAWHTHLLSSGTTARMATIKHFFT
jgi:hypothetical protein